MALDRKRNSIGVCDYGDKCKNKKWQPYAAMAAAYAKAVLARIGPRGPRHVCHIPYRRNHNFTGRKAQLDQLERMLLIEGRGRVALAGLGGMGKTQIALELAYRAQEALVGNYSKQRSVLWMPAQSLEAFHQAAVNVVQKMNLPLSRDDDAKEALRTYLESEASGPWLLILDNLDDMAVLDGVPGHSLGLWSFLPSNRAGRLLITTRTSRIAVCVAGSDVLQLNAMSVDEAYELFETSLIDKTQVNDVHQTRDLLKKLTYLPLTVRQAAYYMNQEQIPVAEYLRLWKSTDTNMISLLSKKLGDETHYSETQGAVATTWMISFDAICRNNVRAKRLLSFIQWIDPKAIPRSMLPRSGSKMGLAASIRIICGYGFLTWQENGETLDMHRLVHLTLRYWFEHIKEGVMTGREVGAHLLKTFPSPHWENRDVWRQYLPHVLPLIKNESSAQDEKIVALGYRAGLCLRFDGRIKEMVEVLELVVNTQKETLTKSHPDRLASQHALSGAYRANGQVKEAIKLLEHVVTIRKETLAESHPDRLASQHSLAIVYKANGQVKEAIKLLEHVITIQKETLSESHPDQLASQQLLARIYKGNGQVKEAIKLLEHVVAIREESLAESHPDRLASEQLLAKYQAKGQKKQQRMRRTNCCTWIRR